MSTYTAKIEERGNGLAEDGDYVSAPVSGSLYRVVHSYGPIHTASAGMPNYQYAIVEDADWDDLGEDDEPDCTAILGDELPISIGDRVESGHGDEHDYGRVLDIVDDEKANIGWDTGVRTSAYMSDLTVC